MIELLIYGIIWYVFLCVCIISAGYHRFYSHGSYLAPKWYLHLVNILGPLTGAGPAIDWAVAHKTHHKNSDTENDPHCPKHVGKFNVLICNYNTKIKPVWAKALASNKLLRHYKNYHALHMIVMVMVILLAFGFKGLIILFVIPYILGRLGMGTLNLFGHLHGKPRNTILGNIVTGGSGEGFHKYHHDDQSNPYIGKKWYQIDLGAYFIKLIRLA